MYWSEAQIHVLDFEGCRRSGIVEYGVVTLHGGRICTTTTRLCRPIGRIDESDFAIHRIRQSDAAAEALFDEEWSFFCRLRASGPLAAHFAGAENHLLKATWPYPPPSPDFSRPGKSINEWGPWIDTGRLYGNLFPELESAKLQAVIDVFGYQPELDRLTDLHCPAARCAYHAALYDALAAALLLLKLLERPQFSSATIPWLLQNSCAAKGRNRVAQQDLFD